MCIYGTVLPPCVLGSGRSVRSSGHRKREWWPRSTVTWFAVFVVVSCGTGDVCIRATIIRTPHAHARCSGAGRGRWLRTTTSTATITAPYPYYARPRAHTPRYRFGFVFFFFIFVPRSSSAHRVTPTPPPPPPPRYGDRLQRRPVTTTTTGDDYDYGRCDSAVPPVRPSPHQHQRVTEGGREGKTSSLHHLFTGIRLNIGKKKKIYTFFFSCFLLIRNILVVKQNEWFE